MTDDQEILTHGVHFARKHHSGRYLTSQEKVNQFLSKNDIDCTIVAAAKVGGILANTNYPADFLLQNLKIQTNVIENAWKYNVKRFLFLGSSCIYPKYALQPIKEEYLLEGPLEKTNDSYAIAKIAGITPAILIFSGKWLV